jgi:hypothetical protein
MLHFTSISKIANINFENFTFIPINAQFNVLLYHISFQLEIMSLVIKLIIPSQVFRSQFPGYLIYSFLGFICLLCNPNVPSEAVEMV